MAWHEQPHGALVRHADNLWSVEGAIPDMGMPLERRMTVVRRADGSLALHSVIALGEGAMRALESPRS